MMSAFQSRCRYAARVVLVAGLIAAGTATRADASDPRAELASVRREIDRVANQYFAAQRYAETLEAQLINLRSRILAADSQRLAVRGQAVSSARALYRLSVRSGDNGPASLLETARAAVFLESATRRDQTRIEQYSQATAQLHDAQRLLQRRRDEQRKVIASLETQTRTLERQLGAAQRAYQQSLTNEANAAAAKAAAEVAAARTSTTRRANSALPTVTTARATTRTTNTTSTSNGGGNGSGGGPVPVDPPPPPAGTNQHHNDPFLACVRNRESRGFYGAVNPGGYYGAYQFAPRTWNITASHAGRPQLIGVRPDRASPWDQDELAWTLFQWQGKGPWGGHCP